MREIAGYAARDLMPKIKRLRSMDNLVFPGPHLDDTQWNILLKFAREEALPILFIGGMGGLRVRHRIEHAAEPAAGERRSVDAVFIEMTGQMPNMLLHDVMHVATQNHRRGFMTRPAFMGGPNDSNEQIPSESELDLPFEFRRYLADQQVTDELYVGAFGLQLIGDKLGSLLAGCLDQNAARATVRILQDLYRPKAPASELELLDRLDALAQVEPYSEAAALDLYCALAQYYIRGSMIAGSGNVGVDQDEKERRARLIDQTVISSLSPIPDDFRRIFTYLYDRRDRLKEEPIMFNLFVAMKDGTVDQMLAESK